MDWKKFTLLITLPLCLTGCLNKKTIQDGPPRYYKDVNQVAKVNPRYLPKSKYGNPKNYTVNGITYHVLPTANGYTDRGIASWYGSKFTGKLTSTRETYDPYKMTAASPVLPIPCFVRVTNLENGRSEIVKVNDRGPFAPNRILDLSYAAATKLGYARKGTALVEVTAIHTDHNTSIWANKPPLGHKPQLFLQVGAFTQERNARALKRRLESMTTQASTIQTTQRNNQSWHLVQLGPLASVGQSDRLQAQLRNDGLGEALTVIR